MSGEIQPGGLNLAAGGLLPFIGGAGVLCLWVAFWCFLAVPATQGDSVATGVLAGSYGTFLFGMAVAVHLLWNALPR